LNKENVVSRVFLFGLFIYPNWELGNPSHLAFFCTHAAAMVSPKSVELKQSAKEPSMEEVKRCELKLPVEIKRTAHICCGGRVPTGAITSRNPVKEENVPTPVRRSARIRGMKRKDYKEVTTPSGCIRCVLQLAVTPSLSSTHRSTNVSRPWRR
jgi:hypothetical protein